jgi:hypothetical protein
MHMRQKCDQILLEIQNQEKQRIESYKTRIKVISYFMFNFM